MDFAWSDDELAPQKSVIKFAREELNRDPMTNDGFLKQLKPSL